MNMMTLKDVARKAGRPQERPSLEQVTTILSSMLPAERRGKWDVVAQRYPRVSLEFLRSRDSQGNPCFAVFHPASNVFWLSSRMRSVTYETDYLFGWDKETAHRGRELSGYFDDVIERWAQEGERQRRAINWWSRPERIVIEATQTLSGIIPDTVRQEMTQVQEVLPRATPYIVAEAGRWDLKSRRVSATLTDPLVVLIPHRTMPPHGYLIAAFDVTTAEDYVRREFAE